MKERIKRVRRELGLTQQQFAERIGIKRNTLANYETGRNAPIDSVLSLICKEFNVSREYLTTGKGEPFVPVVENTLDLLIKEKGLSEGDRILIQKFLTLPPYVRKGILDYLKDVVAELNDIKEELPYEREARLLREQADAIEQEGARLLASQQCGSGKKEA